MGIYGYKSLIIILILPRFRLRRCKQFDSFSYENSLRMTRQAVPSCCHPEWRRSRNRRISFRVVH